MNSEQFAGNWHQLKGTVRVKWGKLTDNDVAIVRGQRERLTGLLQERYGLAKEAANKEIDEWVTAADLDRPATYKAGS